MPTFFARRYMRRPEAVGRTEKGLGILILLLAAGIVATFVIQVASNRDYLFNVQEEDYGPATPERPFPDPGLEGWRAPTRVERFTADDLYVKIDGRADAYLRFNLVGLTFGTYRHQDDADRTVDVYWYDMGTPASALAMYRSEQPPDATPTSIGRDGYQVGGAVFFCKGSCYVQVLPAGLDDADARVAWRIAQRLAERIEE